MNKDRAKELLPIIQAYVSGKQIQFRPSEYNGAGPWIDIPWPSFITGNEYRVKPEPREIYVNEYPGVRYHAGYEDLDSAKGGATSGVVRIGVKYREVIEE